MKHIKYFNESTFNDLYHSKNKWIRLKEEDKLEELKDNLYVLVNNAYSKLGGHVSIQNPDDVLKRDYWLAVDIDSDPDADAVIFGKRTKYGIKISGIGHDGENRSKRELLETLIRLLNKRGFFIEASGRLKDFLENADVKYISDIKILKHIFTDSKNIELSENGEYVRDLIEGNKTEIEKLFGIPLINY